MEYTVPIRDPDFPGRSLINIQYPEVLAIFKNYVLQISLKVHSNCFNKIREHGLKLSVQIQNAQQLQLVKFRKINQLDVETSLIERLKKEKLHNISIWYFQGDHGPEWENFLQHISESSCERLSFECSRLKFNQNIQKVLSSISYTSLLQLNLSASPISSIEMVQFLDAPSLGYIRINGCEVTNIKSLAKTNFKNLNAFLLVFYEHCHVIDLSLISRMRFRQQIDETFSFKVHSTYLSLYDNKNYELTDLRFLLKFQLDKNGVNQLVRKGLKGIIKQHNMFKAQHKHSLIKINQAYERQGIPERVVVELPSDKMLMENMFEKIEKWMNK